MEFLDIEAEHSGPEDIFAEDGRDDYSPSGIDDNSVDEGPSFYQAFDQHQPSFQPPSSIGSMASGEVPSLNIQGAAAADFASGGGFLTPEPETPEQPTPDQISQETNDAAAALVAVQQAPVAPIAPPPPPVAQPGEAGLCPVGLATAGNIKAKQLQFTGHRQIPQVMGEWITKRSAELHRNMTLGDAFATAWVDGAPTKTGVWRIFVTFENCNTQPDLTKQLAFDFFKELFPATTKIAVAQEVGSNGHRHLHCVIIMENNYIKNQPSSINGTKLSFMDFFRCIFWSLGIRSSVNFRQMSGTAQFPPKLAAYIVKEDQEPVLQGFDLDELKSQSRKTKTSSSFTVGKAIVEKKIKTMNDISSLPVDERIWCVMNSNRVKQALSAFAEISAPTAKSWKTDFLGVEIRGNDPLIADGEMAPKKRNIWIFGSSDAGKTTSSQLWMLRNGRSFTIAPSLAKIPTSFSGTDIVFIDAVMPGSERWHDVECFTTGLVQKAGVYCEQVTFQQSKVLVMTSNHSIFDVFPTVDRDVILNRFHVFHIKGKFDKTQGTSYREPNHVTPVNNERFTVINV